MKNVIRVVVALALLAGLYWAFFSGRSPADPGDVETIANRINETTPKTTAGVRLDRASVSAPDTLRMHFTALQAKAADVPAGAMRTEVLKGIATLCTGGGVSDILAANRTVEMAYVDADGVEIEVVTITKADCPK
ncbi:MAG: hypothetical protein RIT81_25390 [Deltaproteobacteria bacterium]